jgi:U1 small nuclear ribonucleoprotein
MTDKLPPNLLALFVPRPTLRYLPHPDHAPEERKTAKISGVAAFLPALEDYKEIPYNPTESWFEKKIRQKAEKQEQLARIVGDDFKDCTTVCGAY